MSKKQIYLLGLLTLIVFPLPAIWYAVEYDNQTIWDFLKLDEIWRPETILGINFGFAYGFLSLLILRASLFRKMSIRIDLLVQSLNLTFWDALFLSVCAGVGEELLFRAGIQPHLGLWLSSILFVAIHGYLNPWNWRMSMYGLFILPFILLIGAGMETFGLWFSIGAHFSYDLLLFESMRRNKI